MSTESTQRDEEGMATAASKENHPHLATLKLLINKETNRVLFAEAPRRFVDALVKLIEIPVGVLSPLFLTKGGEQSGIGRLRSSLDSLGIAFPRRRLENAPVRSFYVCENCTLSPYLVREEGLPCPWCKKMMTTPYLSFLLRFLPGVDLDSNGDLVAEVEEEEEETYVVMDDPTVEPCVSAISGIAMLNRFGVRDVGVLEERVVDFNLKEGMDLLVYSLRSTTVLSDVFLEEEVKHESTSRQKRSMEKEAKLEAEPKSGRRRSIRRLHK